MNNLYRHLFISDKSININLNKKMQQKTIQTFSIAIIIILIVSLILFGIGKLNNIIFWSIIILSAILAYKVIPNLKK